ncbi:hypothetical protein BB559_005096 [Furculomyces boomerangus]|uniref:DUS-like FMN-binding domain-containing protein n=1 Tax=Furculomyces boomerangus TaxID=61424 RepID=A0A2T9YAV2_9FUNG|nr:hypothetical protein BB559_005096 [Furculomyces boomerangus]
MSSNRFSFFSKNTPSKNNNPSHNTDRTSNSKPIYPEQNTSTSQSSNNQIRNHERFVNNDTHNKPPITTDHYNSNRQSLNHHHFTDDNPFRKPSTNGDHYDSSLNASSSRSHQVDKTLTSPQNIPVSQKKSRSPSRYSEHNPNYKRSYERPSSAQYNPFESLKKAKILSGETNVENYTLNTGVIPLPKKSKDFIDYELENTSESILKAIDSESENLSSREIIRDLKLLLSVVETEKNKHIYYSKKAQESAESISNTCSIIQKRIEALISTNTQQPLNNNSLYYNTPDNFQSSKSTSVNTEPTIQKKQTIHPERSIQIEQKSNLPVCNNRTSDEISSKTNLQPPRYPRYSPVPNEYDNSVSHLPKYNEDTDILPTPSNTVPPTIRTFPEDISVSRVETRHTSLSKLLGDSFVPRSRAVTKESMDICFTSKRDMLFSLQSTLSKSFRRKPRGLIVKEFSCWDSSSRMAAVTGSLDGTIQFWDVRARSMYKNSSVMVSEKQWPEYMCAVSDGVVCVALNRSNEDGKESSPGNYNTALANENAPLALVSLYSISHDKVNFDTTLLSPGNIQRNISAIAPVSGKFSGVGNRTVFATCGTDKKIDLWDIGFDSSFKPYVKGVHPVPSYHSAPINSLDFEHQRSLLFSGGSDCRLQASDLNSQSTISNHKFTDRINNVVISPENPNTLLLSFASTHDQFRLIDLRAPLFSPKVALNFGYPSEKNQSRTLVAPMVDVTTVPFLHLLGLISPHGNHTLYTEMFHANAFSKGNLKNNTPKFSQFVPTSNKQWGDSITVQIGTNSPVEAQLAAQELLDSGTCEINLNVGCPSSNVQSGNFGAVLMKTPEKVAEICNSMNQVVGSKSKISVKCRIGIDSEESFDFLQNFMETVYTKGNVTKFVIHARRALLKGLSPKQNRQVPELNHKLVHLIKEYYPEFEIIINGGIDSTEKTEQLLDHLDGVMIGRKIMNDPWFLQNLDKDIYKETVFPTQESVFKEYLEYADTMQIQHGFRLSVLSKPALHFFKGQKARSFRGNLTNLISKAKLQNNKLLEYSDDSTRTKFSTLALEAIKISNREHLEKSMNLVSKSYS